MFIFLVLADIDIYMYVTAEMLLHTCGLGYTGRPQLMLFHFNAFDQVGTKIFSSHDILLLSNVRS